MRSFFSVRAGGQFRMTGTVEGLLKDDDTELKLRLTSWIVDQNLAGIRWPLVDAALLERLRTVGALPVKDRLARLLQAFRRSYPLIGQHGRSAADMLYAASESTEWSELRSLWMYAREQGYAGFSAILPSGDVAEPGATSYVEENTRTKSGAPVSKDFPAVWLTLEGHAWLEGLDAGNPLSDQGFVAMWFDAAMHPIYLDGFARAIEDAGYRPMRVDQGEFAGKIDDEVIAQIRRSRFVVADLTAGLHAGRVIPRGSVYYEAGFAEGLGIPVLYTRREGMKEAVYFDLRQHNFIVWTDAADLRNRLKRRISAVLGDGPLRHNG